MTLLIEPGFTDANLPEALEGADDEQSDALPFRAMGFHAAGVSAHRTVGQSLFDGVAPSMSDILGTAGLRGGVAVTP